MVIKTLVVMNLSEFLQLPIPTETNEGAVSLQSFDVIKGRVITSLDKKITYTLITIKGFMMNYCVVDGKGLVYRIGDTHIPSKNNPTVFNLE